MATTLAHPACPTGGEHDEAKGRRIILSDTVGFISDLPTQLVAAFRATLEEVLEADLILHVRDISHPETEEQAADVGDILDSLGVDEDVALIEVWNKIDALSPDIRAALRRTDARRDDVQAVSALTGEGIATLRDLLAVADEMASRSLSYNGALQDLGTLLQGRGTANNLSDQALAGTQR